MTQEYQLVHVSIRNFRSISELHLGLSPGSLCAIFGPNNVGKTNFLRALDLFFSMDSDKFRPDVDIPYHVFEGSRGGGCKTTIECGFVGVETEREYSITATYTYDDDKGNSLSITGVGWVVHPETGKKRMVPVTPAKARSIVRSFR